MRRRSAQVGDVPRCRYISGIGHSRSRRRNAKPPGERGAWLFKQDVGSAAITGYGWYQMRPDGLVGTPRVPLNPVSLTLARRTPGS
jgi:hypothetical protein